MKWRGRRRSTNVVDQRGQGASRGGGFGRSRTGGMGRHFQIPRGRGGKVSFSGILIMIALFAIAYYLNGDGSSGSGGGFTTSGPSQNLTAEQKAAQDEMAEFTAVVLADTEDVWNPLLPEAFGQEYREPKLVLFTSGVDSGCGFASSAVGPFYCPAGERIYLDLDFFSELLNRFNVEGDFAPAYVIAHEVGHHVQTVLGISAQVREAKSEVGKVAGNKLSVMQELQADCFAGVWANRADGISQILEPGDIQEAMNAAEAIGDDTLQRQAGRNVVPDSFTHGTSAQRQRWFMKGYQTGDPLQCDTYSARTL
ncbi:KPN_02809 family neutral zinc metallopeptidase [Pyruvatibacter sp.]